MIFKTYNCNSFNVHTIKTNKFKTCHMEIVFKKPVIKDELCYYTFLADMLSTTSKKYKTRRDLLIKLEDLYRTVFYGITNKIGNTLTTNFLVDFIDPVYIDEENYLEEVLKLPFEMLQKPNVENDEFDIKSFNIIKAAMKKDIESMKDNPVKYAFKEALKAMDENGPSCYSVLGSIEELDKITPASLYKYYKKLFNENSCDIFLIGNLDMDKVVSIIKKQFKNRIICNTKTDFYVSNNIRKKEHVVINDSEFIQASLIALYNLDNPTKFEKDIVFHVYNYIFGNGGLTSKLYKELREKNSLCYGINSLYLKYDVLLAINVSLENESVKQAITLMKKCVKSMVKGEFTEEILEDAKKNMIYSLDLIMDNNVSIVNNYIFNIYDDYPLVEERKELISKVTKEDVINMAKKIKLNTIYVLKGDQNEGK